MMKNEELLQQIETLNQAIHDKQNEIDRFDVSDYYSEEDYKDSLNDETVEVCGVTMSCGDVLHEMDYTAFQQSYSDHCDGMEKEEQEEYKELLEELEELENQRDDLESELDELENDEEG